MKKRFLIMITLVITFCIAVFGVIQYGNSQTNQKEIMQSENDLIYTTNPVNRVSDFIFDIGPRFGPIKKATIDKVNSLADFLDKDVIASIERIKSVAVIIYEDEQRTDTREIGYSLKFTPAQLNLLRSSNYSTNFLIKAEYQEINSTSGMFENNYASPHLTIVPEKQPQYSEGKEALKIFLRDNSLEARNQAQVEPEKLKPAKLFFTVTKEGRIEHVRLDRSSNYPTVDNKMINLIKNTPGTWIPAENYKGEKVDMELVVSFGLMGC